VAPATESREAVEALVVAHAGERIPICDFRWLDVDGDGTKELLVVVSFSRAFCNTLYVFTSNRLLQELETWFTHDLSRVLEDLDRDSRPELVLPTLVTKYRGAGTWGVFPFIYQWNGARYQRADGAFSAYYRDHVLPRMEARLLQVIAMEPPVGVRVAPADRELHEEMLSDVWVVRDMAARRAGRDREASLARARRWAASPDADLRANAVIAFADVGDATVTGDLEALAQDADWYVAQAAAKALSAWGAHHPR
jgi:hypothetical protein